MTKIQNNKIVIGMNRVEGYNADIVSHGKRYDVSEVHVWVIGYWNLKFMCNLVLGIWSFGTRYSAAYRL